MQDLGAFVLLPTLLVFVLAVFTHRPIESLVAGSLLGLAMAHGTGFISGFAETSLRVMMDETVAWVILVCGFMGSLIALLIRTGATGAFTATMTRWVRSRQSSLYLAWVLGLIMFVDDYLNSLAVGSAMRSLTDKYRVSREMLSYVVDSTAAPVSVIVPLSTWIIFFAALLESNGIAAEGEGVVTYIKAIPLMLYPWAAIALVPLVIRGTVPLMGPMKRAEIRAQDTGVTVPPGAEHIELANQSIVARPGAKPKFSLFVVPMLSLIGFTLYFDLDFLKGVYVSLGATVLYVLATKTLAMNDAFNTVIDGFKTMIEPLGVRRARSRTVRHRLDRTADDGRFAARRHLRDDGAGVIRDRFQLGGVRHRAAHRDDADEQSACGHDAGDRRDAVSQHLRQPCLLLLRCNGPDRTGQWMYAVPARHHAVTLCTDRRGRFARGLRRARLLVRAAGGDFYSRSFRR